VRAAREEGDESKSSPRRRASYRRRIFQRVLKPLDEVPKLVPVIKGATGLQRGYYQGPVRLPRLPAAFASLATNRVSWFKEE
jgi:hypothetical protein